MREKLNKLNCMNYQVNCEITDNFWYAQNGLRSLYTYSANSDHSFKELCLKMLETGQVTLTYNQLGELKKYTLTMI